MTNRKITTTIYNYPTNKSGNLIYGMFKEIGVEVLFMKGAFSIFYFYIEDGEDEEPIIEQIHESIKELMQVLDTELEYEVSVEDEDITDVYINQQNKNFNEPFEAIDGLTIIPSSYNGDLEDSENKILFLDSTNGFGDGRHPTTQTLFWGIKKYAGEGLSILDLGAGTGVLSIYAHLCGCSRIYCCDSNESSKDSILTNLELNDIDSSNMTFYDSIDKAGNEEYSLITVNFPYALTKKELKNIVLLMNEETKLLLSGFHSVKIKDILNHIKENNLQIVDSIHMGEWTMFVCTL